MAIFNLTDIQIKPSSRSGDYRYDTRARVSTSPTTNSAGLYNTNIMRYPLDVGGMDKGHYMIIHIHAEYMPGGVMMDRADLQDYLGHLPKPSAE